VKNSKPDYLMLIPRLRVQNVNCVSGPLTWGFPAVFAFTGFVHALSRKLENGIKFDGAGVSSHKFEPQIEKSGYVNTFRLYRAPVYDRDVTKPSGILEEGRAHVTVSIVTAVYGRIEDKEVFKAEVLEKIGSMRLAGGSIFLNPVKNMPELYDYSAVAEDNLKMFHKLRRKLLPGFVLVDRSEVMAEQVRILQEAEPKANPIDALLHFAGVTYKPEQDEEGKVTWKHVSKKGWMVPIPVGFSAISPLYEAGEVKNVRDASVPFRFVEAAYSVGEWLNPLKLEKASDFIWFHKAETEKGLYLCGHKEI
jgi:CRISPR-associated protein Csy2